MLLFVFVLVGVIGRRGLKMMGLDGTRSAGLMSGCVSEDCVETCCMVS
jgi:hypothetical protein